MPAGDHAIGNGPRHDGEVAEDGDAKPEHAGRRRVIDRVSEQAEDRRMPGGLVLPVRPPRDACQLLDAVADGLDARGGHPHGGDARRRRERGYQDLVHAFSSRWRRSRSLMASTWGSARSVVPWRCVSGSGPIRPVPPIFIMLLPSRPRIAPGPAVLPAENPLARVAIES